MDKYRLVQEHTADDATENDNTKDDDAKMNCEVRITQQGKPRNYISYAMKLFVRANEWLNGWMDGWIVGRSAFFVSYPP